MFYKYLLPVIIAGFVLGAVVIIFFVYYGKDWFVSPSALALVLNGEKLSFDLKPKGNEAKLKELGIDSEKINATTLTVSTESAHLAEFLNRKPISFEIKEGSIKFNNLSLLDLGSRLQSFNVNEPEALEARAFPENTFLYVKSKGLEKLMDFPGLEILTKRGLAAFGIFPVGKDIGFAFVQKINEGEGLGKDFEDLKLAPLTEENRTDALGVGISNNLVNDVEVKTLTLPNLSLVPTFGVIKDTLVIASNGESFGRIVDVQNSKENNLSNQPDFHKLNLNYQKAFSELTYLDLKSIKDIGLEKLKDSAKEYFTLEYSKDMSGVIEWLLKQNKLITTWGDFGFRGELVYD